MTEKRFTINSYSSYDTTTIKDNSSTRVLSVIDCVDELNYLNKVGNELYKKNEQLKSTVEEMIKIFNDSGLDYCLSDEVEEILND